MDSYFLPKPIEEIIEKQEFSKVPLITGITDDEFGFLLAAVSKHLIYFMTVLNIDRIYSYPQRPVLYQE